MTLEERIETLEAFIGNIDEVKLYGNSLQELVDKYMSPLYIDSGSGHILLVNDYLGDLENVPRNVIFKVRASHDLNMGEETDAKLRFLRPGQPLAEFTLRKYSEGLLKSLETGNYTAGIIYDIYINSQDIAIITSNDTATLALSEIGAIRDATEALETKMENITLSDGVYNIPNVSITSLEVGDVTIQNKFLFGSTPLEVRLPAITTIDPSPTGDESVINKAYLITKAEELIEAHMSATHLVGTEEASSALSGKPNGTFYFKLED